MLDGNSAAELTHDLAVMRAPRTERHLEDAREWLVDRLIAGESAHGVTRDDIFACALEEPDEPTHDRLLELLLGALALNALYGDDRMLESAALGENARRFVERFVDAHPEWIEERAQELAAAAREEAEEN